MVVDHPGSLHEGIADGGADELEAGLGESAAHGFRLGGGGGHLRHAGPGVLQRLAVDEGPQVIGKRSGRCGQLQIGTGIADGGRHLGAIADDAGVGQQPRRVGLAVVGDDGGVEAFIGKAIGFAFLEDGGPGQAGLGASRINNSNKARSSTRGVPHSRSW